jgi:DNA invertase Pin-like site-specific DNA recombinase
MSRAVKPPKTIQSGPSPKKPIIRDLPPEKTLHIYTRVSTEGQKVEGTSLETQYEEGVRRAEQHDLFYRHWDEGGRSSNHEEISARPTLNSIYLAIKAGEIKHLFVYDQSRLSRNDLVASVFRYECRKNGVTIYTKDGKYDLSNPSDNLLTQLMNAVAEFDNTTRSDKVRRGRLKKAKLGYWFGSTPPYGYKVVDQRLTINGDEAPWLKRVFEERAAGVRVTDIVKLLDANNVKPRIRRKWSHASVRAIIRNTHSMGYYTVIDRINGGDFRINCEPIITADLWKKANDSIDQEWVRRMSRPKNRTAVLFRSLTYCGHCGLRFTIYDSEATTTTLYYCPHKQREYARIGKALYNKKRFTGCGMDRGIRVNVFEKAVIKLMTSVMAKEDIFKARFELAVMSERTLIKSPHQLRYINQQLTELTGLRNSISELVERSERKSSQELHEREGVAYTDHKNRIRIKELEEEIDRLKLRLSERDQYLSFSKWLSDTRSTLSKFDDLNHEERKKFVYEVIDGIEVRFSRKTKSHTLKVVFRNPLIGIKRIDIAHISERAREVTEPIVIEK